MNKKSSYQVLKDKFYLTKKYAKELETLILRMADEKMIYEFKIILNKYDKMIENLKLN